MVHDLVSFFQRCINVDKVYFCMCVERVVECVCFVECVFDMLKLMLVSILITKIIQIILRIAKIYLKLILIHFYLFTHDILNRRYLPLKENNLR